MGTHPVEWLQLQWPGSMRDARQVCVAQYGVHLLSLLCVQHAMLPDAHNQIVSNRLFTGVAFPEKLESYMHRTAVPGGPTLAQDLRGSWSIQFDPFKKVATCRCVGGW